MKTHSRRRVLKLMALSTGLAGADLAMPAALPAPRRWQGMALGAPASIVAYDEHPRRAARALREVVAEISRLERIFSLHRSDSALARLNADGRLTRPPAPLVELLLRALALSVETAGAFDPTVQPLWRMYAGHYRANPARADGPGPSIIEAALQHVDFRALHVSSDCIGFTRPSMAITLNGIAQGYIVDRLVERFAAHGLRTALLDAGEIRALGHHPGGRPWRVGVRDPRHLAGTFTDVELDNEAIATSAYYGTVFDIRGRHHHLFDPRSGLSTKRHASVSVVCRDATTADALSTAFSNMPTGAMQPVLALHAPARAVVLALDGTVTCLQS